MSEYEVVHFLQNSDSMLQNPDSFEPEELAQYFASYASYGVHDSITTLLQRHFYANLNHPQIIRFIRLIDQLIRISYPLPNAFPDMFIECFQIFQKRGQRSLLQELTILRKMWTPILQPSTIFYLRQEIFNRLNVDLDFQIREESKKFLRNYFQKCHKLHPAEISAIVDIKYPLRKALLQNHEYMNIPQQDLRKLSTQEDPRKYSFHEEDPRRYSFHEEDPRRYSFHQEDPIRYSEHPRRPSPEEGQRKNRRDRSYEDQRKFTTGSKKVKLDQIEQHNNTFSPSTSQTPSARQKAMRMLVKLQEMSEFKCRECGKRFSLLAGLKKHEEAHFHSRMKTFTQQNMNEGLRKLKLSKTEARREKSTIQFIGETNQLVLDSTYIAVKQNTRKTSDSESGPLRCQFCDRQFAIVFKDEMLYKDIVKVRFQADSGKIEQQKIHYMHSDCYLALSQS